MKCLLKQLIVCALSSNCLNAPGTSEAVQFHSNKKKIEQDSKGKEILQSDPLQLIKAKGNPTFTFPNA